MLFVNILKAPYINHLLKTATKSFSDINMFKEIIANVIRSEKIDAEKMPRGLFVRERAMK